MKPLVTKARFICIGAVGMLVVLLGTQPAAAADSPDGWRKTYDLILLWINFGIFVFLMLKFLRKPLKKFISDKQSELERKISRLEDEKNEVEKKIEDILKATDESQAEFDLLKQKIIEQGEIKKRGIIEDARQKSRVMVEQTQLRVQNRIHHARKTLRDELVDAAFEVALEKLPRIMTAEDNLNLIQDYIAGAVGK